MIYIKKISLRGFKSFGNQTIILPLFKGINAITGSKSSGKSNLLEAASFALGTIYEQNIPQRGLTDLIFTGTPQEEPAQEAEVTLSLDNTAENIRGYPMEVNLTRWVRSDGTSDYAINETPTTREDILAIMAKANIDPVKCIWLQDRVAEIILWTTIQRRQFLENLFQMDEFDLKINKLQTAPVISQEKIDQIIAEKTRSFTKAFQDFNREFASIFQDLNKGGTAKMFLHNPETVFDGGVDIDVRFKGKNVYSLSQLSRAEKALVAVSFIFAIYKNYKIPFIMIDQIENELETIDNTRVAQFLKLAASQMQVVIVSTRSELFAESMVIYKTVTADGISHIYEVDSKLNVKRQLGNDDL